MKRLSTNYNAPLFKQPDFLGNEIHLNKYKDSKVLISFFRGAACPFCNLRIHQLINNFDEFEKRNIKIIAFFAASQSEIAKYAGQQNPPFPIIPDPDLKIYKLYGIEKSFWGMAKTMMNPGKMMNIMRSKYFNMKSVSDKPLMPADFVLDKNFVITHAYYGKDFGDHIPLEELFDKA